MAKTKAQITAELKDAQGQLRSIEKLHEAKIEKLTKEHFDTSNQVIAELKEAHKKESDAKDLLITSLLSQRDHDQDTILRAIHSHSYLNEPKTAKLTPNV